VPSDLSVVGMLSDLVTPRLTTVVQPVAKIAEAAVALLLGAERAADAPILLECELVVRDSTAPAPEAGVKSAVLRQKA
jgi:LacI family transcriptional regulator